MGKNKKQKQKSKQKQKPKPKPNPKPKQKIKSKSKRVLYCHSGYISCSLCDMCPIRGARYVCMVRENYNICEECEKKLCDNDKLQYPMIKIYKPRPNWHIKNFKGLQDLVAIPEMEINKNQKQSSKQTKTANKPFNNQITQNEENKQNKEK